MHISIHASAKEATLCSSFWHAKKFDFNPRLREGGDQAIAGVNYNMAIFQSTPPRRRRLNESGLYSLIFDFNPRLREGGDSGKKCKLYSILYFNPRLREGGDHKLPAQHRAMRISIHASAKEATYLSPVHHLCLPYFNPRLREGGDHRHQPRYLIYMEISIHASAKEATVSSKILALTYRFQSTPPRRRRHSLGNGVFFNDIFQSTPPRRRRRAERGQAGGIWDFNPRLREGGDLVSEHHTVTLMISIHASAKEATKVRAILGLDKIFQSTPPRRRRRHLVHKW